MKKITLSILLAFCTFSAINAQSNLLAVGFEATEAGEGTDYRSNTYNDGFSDVWARWNISASADGPNSNFSDSYSKFVGNYAWGGEDLVTSDNPLGSLAPCYLVFKTIDVTAVQGQDIEVSALLGASDGGAYENADFVSFEYAFDGDIVTGAGSVNGVPTLGNIETGTYTIAGKVHGDVLKFLSDDAGLDGVGDGSQFVLSPVMQKVKYTISIPGGVTLLSVRMKADLNGSSEDLVIDDFSIDTVETLSASIVDTAKINISAVGGKFVSVDASLTIAVYNALGQEVANESLPQGIYILKIINTNGEQVSIKKAI